MRLASEPDAYATGWVTSSYLHVRDRAGVGGELLGTLQNQEPVQIVEPNPAGGWYKIWFEGRYAYVSAEYIHIGSQPVETTAGVTTPAPSEQTAQPRIVGSKTVVITGVGACKTAGVIVRSEPSVQSAQYGTLAIGDQICFLERECAVGWDKIFVFTGAARGYIGYIHSRYAA